MKYTDYVYILPSFSTELKGKMVAWSFQSQKRCDTEHSRRNILGLMEKYFILWEGEEGVHGRERGWQETEVFGIMVSISLWYRKRDASLRMQRGELSGFEIIVVGKLGGAGWGYNPYTENWINLPSFLSFYSAKLNTQVLVTKKE